jgi:UDP-N-acetylmuramoylalanine--D-glutamate ligase
MIPVRRYRDRIVGVFGLGRSGLAAARALHAGGARVVAWDDGEGARAAASAAGLALADPLAGGFAGAAALVLAPGIPLTHPAPHPAVRWARAAQVPVIGDIELLLGERLPAKLIGVTGTNGKSTTTALIGHLLREAGRAVEVGGNIGTAALALAPLGADGTYVLEMSSFQLDLAPSWHADVAVLLNVTPDHLDRHGSMEGYVALKRRIFARQGPGDTAVIGVDDEHGARIAAELSGGARVVPVAIGRRLAKGVSVADGLLCEDGAGVGRIDALPSLPGAHNWQNAAAAYASAQALGLGAAEILRGLASFPGLAHRMERVGEIDGVVFVNDSKATNADAAAKALACYDGVYWIAGGRAKAGGIAGLAGYFPRIRHAFLIGEAADDFARTLDGAVPVTRSGTLAAATAAAFDAARREGRAGAVVLLSPACASYDQFRDFEQRGDGFRRLVAELAARRAPARGGAAA